MPDTPQLMPDAAPVGDALTVPQLRELLRTVYGTYGMLLLTGAQEVSEQEADCLARPAGWPAPSQPKATGERTARQLAADLSTLIRRLQKELSDNALRREKQCAVERCQLLEQEVQMRRSLLQSLDGRIAEAKTQLGLLQGPTPA